MPCHLRVQPYGRRLRRPLTTAHGSWRVRRGIFVRLDMAGRLALATLLRFPGLGRRPGRWLGFLPGARQPDRGGRVIRQFPAHLPACQVGLASALAHVSRQWRQMKSLSPAMVAGLVPAGPVALEDWQPLWWQGHRCFKWKVGAYPVAAELAWLRVWLATLPPGARVRLDANGGLTEEAACAWLQACDRINATSCQIEFLEQPLPPEQLPALRRLSREYRTPIALDESVATVHQLVQVLQQGWQGIVVLKPAIAGSPQTLQQICQHWSLDCVISSALESPIGQRAVLARVPALGTTRALGWGVNHWFDDGWEHLSDEHIWQRVSQDSAAVFATRSHG
ncbi:o-succinylbenzoate synthase [Halomicronema hongdechloris C2206]|uniref:o-succinylbenzoate synthase n=1 Tax=Halomicronema hongdechloris C2206 TaxID=1641165 RepID=A0A1Z3HUK8_9CYAN|nr:o-succinylbenzoate synthase [Halomicronema hongdechloris]ASC73994.1 o-succinylbenzoate synthase [Halomicronema hongdechloris C2206]